MRNICIAFIFLFMFSWLIAGEDYREIRLKSHWKFQIGDDMTYANTDFDDSQWSTIRIRKKWEDQGYPAYDGYAWYRTKFYLSKKIKGKSLNLYLGNIDDVDAVYMNGQYIGGHGQFPPHYNTAYNIDRKYHLLAKNLFYGDENVIAVRVYDHEGSGGIMWGRVGVYSEFTVKIYKLIN